MGEKQVKKKTYFRRALLTVSDLEYSFWWQLPKMLSQFLTVSVLNHTAVTRSLFWWGNIFLSLAAITSCCWCSCGRSCCSCTRSHLIWHIMGVTVARFIEDSDEADKSEAEDDIMAAVDRIVTETRARRDTTWAGLGWLTSSAPAALAWGRCVLRGRGHHQRVLLGSDVPLWPPESNPHLKNRLKDQMIQRSLLNQDYFKHMFKRNISLRCHSFNQCYMFPYLWSL